MSIRVPLASAARIAVLCGALLSGAAAARAQAPPYLLFESGPVRPIALSPDGTQLFVANTPDGHLEIFDVGTGGLLTPAASVPVGLEPVAVAARNNTEVWVVNHLSDSVSIVDVASSPPRVRRTLLVGDEPRDIVFAGTPQRAFISTAHRGQQRTHASIAAVAGAGDPQLLTEGTGRADVWVFDAATPGSALGGIPVRILTFFADTPRALATNGTSVWLAAFHSGNRSTIVNQAVLQATGRAGFVSACGGSGQGTGVPGPATNQAGSPAPPVGLIVRRVGNNWVDSLGCTWNSVAVNFSLPDRDVFAVNANTLTAGSIFTTVGTILFNMAVNPVTGKLYVSNTDSPNHVAFEGPGNFGGTTVQGHLSESRITVIDPVGGTVAPKHLNKHIDYNQLHTDVGANHAAIEAQKAHSLATPLQVVVSNTPGDQRVYVAAFGSGKVGVFDASDLEDPSFAANFDPTAASARYIATGGGPAGLALNGANDRLYVLTRFDQSVSVYAVSDTGNGKLQSVKLPTPEPDSLIEGRPFLYDAVATSGNGEASCASCHIFGDLDSLGWNLGNPDDVVTANPQPQALSGDVGPDFHPMKGPMTTQTLRGLSTHGAMHWRGDRANGFFGEDACTGSSLSNAACDEDLAFRNFIVAFEGLIGMEGTVTPAEMQKFTDFALGLMLPPNPIANLDGTQTADQAAGENIYFNVGTDVIVDGVGTVPCNGCHTLNEAQGFFGADGRQSNEGLPQRAKIPHTRNAYQKVGMFGFPGQANPGEQIRGFGYLHDGSVPTLFDFFELGTAFSMTPAESRQMEQFILAFPTDLAPVVGQQVTIGPGSPGSCTNANCNSCLPAETACQDVSTRINLFQTRAAASFSSFVLGGTVTECEVIAKTVEAGGTRGYLRQAGGSYLPDDGGPAIGEAVLRAKAGTAAQNIQYLCAPPGSGERMGIDRDLDAVLDGVDNCPAWPNGAALGSCTAGAPDRLAARCTSASDCGAGGFCSLAQEDDNGNGNGDACEPALIPEPDAAAGLAMGLAALALLSRRRAEMLRRRA
jgi:DNA-binding beta-propeller fold protein YncE